MKGIRIIIKNRLMLLNVGIGQAILAVRYLYISMGIENYQKFGISLNEQINYDKTYMNAL